MAQTADLAPGEALEAGCGEGADAIWLARQGWTVTAVDVSAVALERGAGYAAAAGDEIARRVTWQREDLLSWDPGPERFDLVSAQFMYAPAGELEPMHRRLAAAVRPGGTLLVVGHHADDLHANVGRTGSADQFWSAQDIAACLDPGSWEVSVAEAPGRSATDLDGQAGDGAGHRAAGGPRSCLAGALALAVVLVVLVVLVLDAEEVLGLLLAGLDLAVEPARPSSPRRPRAALSRPWSASVGVLAGELLRLVHEFRHGFFLPFRLIVQLVTQRRRSDGREQPRVTSGISGIAWGA